MTALNKLTKAQLIEMLEARIDEVAALTIDRNQWRTLANERTAACEALEVKLQDQDTTAFTNTRLALDSALEDLMHTSDELDAVRDQFSEQLLNVTRERDDALAQAAALRARIEASQQPRTVKALREPNEVERRRLNVLTQCQQLAKQHGHTVWYDWKHNEYRTKIDGIVHVLEAV